MGSPSNAPAANAPENRTELSAASASSASRAAVVVVVVVVVDMSS